MKAKPAHQTHILTKVIPFVAALACGVSASAGAAVAPGALPSEPPSPAAGAAIVVHPSMQARFYSWKINKTATVAKVRLDDGLKAVPTWPVVSALWVQFSSWLTTMGLAASPSVAGQLADVTAIYYDASFLYVEGSGLASHPMGPWHSGTGGYFEFRPSDPATVASWTGSLRVMSIPRVPAPAAAPVRTDVGPIGRWINGTSIYNPMSGNYYSAATGAFAVGKGYWNQDANWAESATFDTAGFHQDGPGPPPAPGAAGPPYKPVTSWGQYHGHINPLGLRWEEGDSVVAITDPKLGGEIYDYEETAPVGHSPILGFARDGLPVYGPYGYIDPSGGSTKVRRMRSGYVLRDGTCGSWNLSVTGRSSLPVWAITLYVANSAGPNVSVTFPLGCFMEDYAYRGHLTSGGTYGVDWDLDESNARWCVTPEYPYGTWAYFVTIDENTGAPQFPYVVGPAYKYNPAGTELTALPKGLTKY